MYLLCTAGSDIDICPDRILCWELVSKRNSSWLLHYVKSAYVRTHYLSCRWTPAKDVGDAQAVTDVPDQLPELISQRRRWLNGMLNFQSCVSSDSALGSFFAAIHSTVHFGYLYRSSHSFTRKAWLHVELLYSIFNLVFAWFALVCACLFLLLLPLIASGRQIGIFRFRF